MQWFVKKPSFSIKFEYLEVRRELLIVASGNSRSSHACNSSHQNGSTQAQSSTSMTTFSVRFMIVFFWTI